MMAEHDDMNLASLLRAAADDELSAEQRERLEAHLAAHPEDADRIEFERQLRRATGRVMADVETPIGLRERLETRLAKADDPIVIRPRRLSRTALAAAASFILIAGVMFALLTPSSPIGPDARYRSSVVRFLHSEHSRCWVDAEEILRKFSIRERAELPEGVADLLDRPVSLEEVTHAELNGLVFQAAGRCAVPGRGPSVHIGFETDGSIIEAGIPVSLFIQVDPGRWDLEEDVTYLLTNERRIARGVCTIYVWKRNGLLHFLVSDDARACDQLREALDAPETIKQL